MSFLNVYLYLCRLEFSVRDLALLIVNCDLQIDRALNQAVSRNPERFPEEFMFQLSWQEVDELESRSQNVILDKPEENSRSQNGGSKRGKNVKYRPQAFTQEGVAMLSSVLKS